MKKLVLLTFFLGSFVCMAQKPNLDQSYKFKASPKISLKSLRIPSTAGRHVFMELPSDGASNTEEVKKTRGPAAAKNFGSKNKIMVSGACTNQDGRNFSVNDPDYESCLNGSVYVKKVILTEPTQSILMNLNLDGLNFNPFE